MIDYFDFLKEKDELSFNSTSYPNDKQVTFLNYSNYNNYGKAPLYLDQKETYCPKNEGSFIFKATQAQSVFSEHGDNSIIKSDYVCGMDKNFGRFMGLDEDHFGFGCYLFRGFLGSSGISGGKTTQNLYLFSEKELVSQAKIRNEKSFFEASKRADTPISFPSTIQIENKKDLGNSQLDNTKKLPSSFDASATSEKNKIKSKPEEDLLVNEKKIKNKFENTMECKIEIKEEPKKLQQNFDALSQSNETLKEGEFICPNENKVDVEKKVHFDQPDHKTQTTNFSSKKFLTKKIYKQKKYRLNSNLIGITEGQKGKEKQKHKGSFVNNLRKKALRKGLKSFDEKILGPKIAQINEEKKILGRKTKNILWKPNILDKDAFSLKGLKDFAKRSMKDIYENLEPKHCSSKGINKNKDNIKKVYESSESIKDLFDLKFIEVIKIYLDKNNNNLDKKKIDLFKDDFSFDKDFEEDKNKNKRKKVIEKFIESVENDKNVESDKQKSKK